MKYPFLGVAAVVVLGLVAGPGSVQGACDGSCTAVYPTTNVPLNLDTSSAVHLTLAGDAAWRFWASGDSYHAPDCGGRYSDVLLASGYGEGTVLSIPIGGEPVAVPAGEPGSRIVNLFFVEFGSGELGDNHGTTTVFYQPAAGGAIGSVVVSPVTNVVMNLAGSSAAVHDLDLSQSYTVCATGASQYAGEQGYYRGVFLCTQWGLETKLKAVPIDSEGRVFLGAIAAATNPAYLWFPEFGSGYLGDNHGGTEVCFDPLVPENYNAVRDYQGASGWGAFSAEYEEAGYHPMDFTGFDGFCYPTDGYWGVSCNCGWAGPVYSGRRCIPTIVMPNNGLWLLGHAGQEGGLSGYDSVLRWTAPRSGAAVSVRATFRGVAPSGGDGIEMTLRRGTEVLDSFVIAAADTTTHYFDLLLENVAEGEILRLQADALQDNYNDLYAQNLEVGYLGWPTPAPEVDPAHANLSILGVYPNPSAGSVEVRLSEALNSASGARLEVFDAGGRLVRSLAPEASSSIESRVTWDGRDRTGRRAEAGVYFLKLKLGARTASMKLTRMQ